MTQAKFNLLLFLTTFICTVAFSQPDSKPEETFVAQLKKFRTDYVKSILDEKSETIISFCAEGIRLMPEFQKTMIGKNNALTYYKAFFNRFEILEYRRTEIEILDLGYQVAELGTFSMKMKLKSTGQNLDLNGKYQNFWKKVENDKLILITEAWNYDHRVEIPDQLKFQEIPQVNIAMESHLPINNNITFELAALNRLLEMAIVQYDAKLWSQFYSDDIKYVYSNNPIISGRKSMDEFLEEHVKQLPVFEKLDIRNDQIDDLGNYIIEYASHIAIIRHGDYSGVHTGKDIRIWRREKDCSLKTFRAIAMYD